MAKDFVIGGDLCSDATDSACDTMKDFRGDLASNDGVDLNAGENDTADIGVKESVSKNGKRFAAGINAVFAGVSGVGSSLPPEMTGDSVLPPVVEIRTEYNLPNTQIDQMIEQYEQTGEVPTLPFELNGEDDDGKFDPNKPREAEELNNILNETVSADHCDPPEQQENMNNIDDVNEGE